MWVLDRMKSIWNASANQKAEEVPFMDQHFAKVAFMVASLALFLFSPLNFLLSTALGAAFHHTIEPNPKVEVNKIESSDAVFAIVGAVAAVLKWTPAGQAGNLLFQSIPFFCSLLVGRTVYRLFSAIT